MLVNGLGFEGWLERLVKASGTKAAVTVTTKGIKPRQMKDDGHGHGHGNDPHAWQSVANARIYVANIRDALVKADPAGKAAYEANATAYLAKLDALEAEVKATVAAIPAERRKIITTHDCVRLFRGRLRRCSSSRRRASRPRPTCRRATSRRSSGRSRRRRYPRCSWRTSPTRG